MKSKTAATVTAGERHANNVPATGKPKLNVRLLRRVQKHILEEPRRFFMSWFVATAKPGSRFRSLMGGDDLAKTAPPCGTAACIAGWANILSGVRPDDAANPDNAIRVLGLDNTSDQPTRLFNHYSWPQPFSKRFDKAKTPAARAKIGAARIEHFIKTKGAE